MKPIRYFGSKRARIIAACKANPNTTDIAIARKVGTTAQHVRDVRRECGLAVPSVFEIGRTVRELGLSLDDLRTFAEQRRAG